MNKHSTDTITETIVLLVGGMSKDNAGTC